MKGWTGSQVVQAFESVKTQATAFCARNQDPRFVDASLTMHNITSTTFKDFVPNNIHVWEPDMHCVKRAVTDDIEVQLARFSTPAGLLAELRRREREEAQQAEQERNVRQRTDAMDAASGGGAGSASGAPTGDAGASCSNANTCAEQHVDDAL